MAKLDRGDIEAFLGRDWARAARLKDEYWIERTMQLGPIEGLRVADELRRQVLAQRPDWPSEEERQADLASHLRVAEILRHVSASRR